MGLTELRNLKLDQVLFQAADQIQKCGLAKGVRYDPSTGAIDLVGALALALQSKPEKFISSVSLTDTGVPAINEAKMHLVIDYLDSLIPEVETWADSPTVTGVEVQRFLRKAASRIRIAVV